MPGSATGGGSVIPVVMNIVLVTALMLGCAFFARRNIAAGRGDRKGAFRIMVFVSAVGLLDWLTGAHLTGSANELFNRFMDNLGDAVFLGVFLYVIYLALEPFIRRRMPQLLISWSRLLAGKFRDPLVARDALLGLASGTLMVASIRVVQALPWWFDIKGMVPSPAQRSVLGDFSLAFSLLCTMVNRAFINSLAMLGVFFLLSVVLRKKALASLGLAITMTLLFAGESANISILAVTGAIYGGLMALVLLRLGQLAFLNAWFTLTLLNNFAAPLDLGRWYGSNVMLAVASLAGLTLYCFYVSLGGKPIFGTALED